MIQLSSRTRGSILVLVSWVLVFLTIVSLSIGFLVRQRLNAAGKIEDREKLRLIAEAGVKKVISIHSKSGKSQPYDALNDSWSRSEMEFKEVRVGDGTFMVSHLQSDDGDLSSDAQLSLWYGAVDENRKININLVSDPNILRALIRDVTGLDDQEAVKIAESIFDWRDEDDSRHLSGAESRYYESLSPPYRPKNAPFSSLEELLLVQGMTEKILNQLRPYLTLFGTGTINLNTASKKVLKAIGVNDSIVKKILSYRRGLDGKMGTRDDQAFSELSSIASELEQKSALNDDEKTALEASIGKGLLAVKSTHFMIESVGTLDHKKKTHLKVLCVAEQNGNIVFWNEKFLSD